MYRAVRGTSDILPEEQAYFTYIKNKAEELCRLYGYQRIDNPVFEETGLFIRSTGEGTDIVEKEMYRFEDRGGVSLTLRPEGTPSVCRAYIEHGMSSLPQPVRLYYIAPLFRYERPQAGRYRQHYQFGFEAIGESDPALDAEVIDMVWNFLYNLGLSKLMLYINSIGCTNCRPHYIESLTTYYRNYIDRICSDCKIRLEKNPLRLLDCKKDSCISLVNQAPRSTDYLCEDCNNHYTSLTSDLNLLHIPFKLNHTLVRGLDYYTRTVFEIQPEDAEGAQVALGGGGRYDNLILNLGGKQTPAMGCATGLERIVLNLKRQNVQVPPIATPQVFVAYVGQEAKESSIKLTAELRKAGIGVTQSLGDRSLKSQLRQAGSLKKSYAIIIGEEELKSNTVVLRNMEEAKQETVSTDNIITVLSQIRGI